LQLVAEQIQIVVYSQCIFSMLATLSNFPIVNGVIDEEFELYTCYFMLPGLQPGWTSETMFIIRFSMTLPGWLWLP